MKKASVLLFFLFFAAALTGLWAGGQKAEGGTAPKALVPVNMAVHSNGSGASVIAIAIERGLFKEYGIDPKVTIVESGPSEMAAMRADNPTLDFGFIGPGVAWNPIDSTGNSLSFIFFDNLGNSERMLARKSQFKDANGNGTYDQAELYAGLKGKTVYFEVGTTPGGWFKNLLDAVNQNYASGDKLWIHCEDAAYVAGYTAPNNKPENRVLVVNYLNANIPAGMATAGSNTVDIAVAYEPVPSTILNTVKDVEQVADINSLPEGKVFPSTFVANTKWMKANPELARSCVFVLYRAAVWRTENPTESMRIAERLCARPEGTFVEYAQYFPKAGDYREWFATTSSSGYSYLRSLYDERLPNVPQGVTPKPFEQAIDFAYMLEAIKEL